MRLFAALLLVVGIGGNAVADEEILSYVVDIEVLPNSTLDITENIKVRAEGLQIKRGIYRDFPTQNRLADGSEQIVGFKLVEILRNGKPEPYHTENYRGGIRIYIGQKDVFIPTGVYTYAIRYRTTRQLRFDDNYDELYWNVTGNYWSFPILHAEAHVSLPDGARIGELDAFTGEGGQARKDFRILSRSDSNFAIETTRPLKPNEGLTILTRWQKGIVLPGYEVGLAAAKRGDYETALRILRPLADQGDANAQSS
ncbi:MAG TPA: DUF2207 domain-containing protein, partial [Afifellaceae bacterium]|nr:DUF2207 domain-containing protein [Afifellaceae bacterium]